MLVELNEQGRLRKSDTITTASEKATQSLALINEAKTELTSVSNSVTSLRTDLQEKYEKPQAGIPETDLQGQIPESKLSSELQAKINAIDTSVPHGLDVGTTALYQKPFITIGNSYHVPDAELHSNNSHYTQMIVRTFNMSSLTTQAVGGTYASEIAIRALSTDPDEGIMLRNKAFVGAAVIGNNMLLGDSARNRATVRTATEALLATMTADAIIPATSATFVYSGGFNAYPFTIARGGKFIATLDDGAYMEFTFAGEQGVDILFHIRSNTIMKYRIIEMKNGNENLIGELSLDLLLEGERHYTPAVYKVRGIGPGIHTIRVMKIAGGSMIIDGIMIPSKAPRAGYIIKELPPDLARIQVPNADLLATREVLWQEVAAVLEQYPTIMSLAPSTEGWDPATMTADGLHANDRGQQYLYNEIAKSIADTPYSKGNGNILDKNDPYPEVYIPPAGPVVPLSGQSGANF